MQRAGPPPLSCLGRSPSTISRELRRNASTRSYHLEYRASLAQWHAERRAQRPKPAKLVADERLREYVQDRLAGNVVHALDGRVVEGPQVAPWQGRNKPPSGPPLGELLGPKVLPGVQGVAGVAERPVHADRLQVDGTSSWSASRSSPHMRATAPDGRWPAEAFSCGGGEILDGRARV
ncbi:hypothetical protein GCM10010392_66340 [Streptomyces clavifer]|nr:hypothetical protein GCM10010392_66340 [Streptomyces clavifer]